MAVEVGAVEVAAVEVAGAAQSRRGRRRGWRTLAERRETLAARSALIVIPAAAIVVCVAAARTPALDPQTLRPATGWLAGPFRYLAFRLPVSIAIALVASMFCGYVLTVRHAARLPARGVLAAVITLQVIVLLGPPLVSTDVFSYQAYAQMFSVYHVNPYTHGPGAIGLSSVYPFIDSMWINTPSVYGPAFTLISSVLAGGSVLQGEITFRVLAAVCSIAVTVLLWQAAKLRRVEPKTVVIVWGLNPLVALFAVGGGHNDVLMLLLSTLGIYMLLRARHGLAGAAIVTAAAIKLTGVLVLPFALASHQPGRNGALARRRTLLGVAAAGAVIAPASYLCFGDWLQGLLGTLQRVQTPGRLQSVPGILFEVFAQREPDWLTVRLDVLLVIVCVWLLARVWDRRLDWLDGAGWATAALLLLAGALLPWYVCWLLPLCALTHDRRLRHAALWMTGIGVAIGAAGFLPGGLPILRL